MLQARAAWRLLHGPDSSQEPVAIMLPKLERRELPVNSPEAKAAAAAAAAARLERAEAAAQAAALRAASLAGASGLPYRPPEGLTVDLSGVDVADLSELERQVEVVRRAQEARQAAAAAAAAAAQAAAGSGQLPPPAETPPTVLPLVALFGEGYQARGPSAATPPKSWLLKAKDLKAGLQGKLVQTLWPDEGQWWPAVVLHVSLADKSLTLLYETGDEEEVQFPLMVQAAEVAWLLGPSGAATPRAAVHSPSPNRTSPQQQQQGGTPPSSGRRQPSAGRPKSPQHGSTASAPAAEPAPAAAQQAEQQVQHPRAASGEAGLSGSLGEPAGGPVQHGWPPLGEAMDLDGDVRGSSPQLLGDSGPVGTSSEGTGALLPPLSVGGAHGFGSSTRLGGHRGSELLLVDNPAFGGLGMLPSMHLDSPAEPPQQQAVAAEQERQKQEDEEEQQPQQEEPPPPQQEQTQQQQEQPQPVAADQQEELAAAAEQEQRDPAQHSDGQQQEQLGEQQADGEGPDAGSQQPVERKEQHPEAQQQGQATAAPPQPQPEEHTAAPPELEHQAELQAAEQQLPPQSQPSQQQPGSQLGSEHAATTEQQAAEGRTEAEHQPTPVESPALVPPLQQSVPPEQQTSTGPAEPARCCADGQCSKHGDTPCLPDAKAGKEAEAAQAAEDDPAGQVGSDAPDSAGAEQADSPTAAGQAAAGVPAPAAEEETEAPQAATPPAAQQEAPQPPAAAAPAAAVGEAQEQPAQLSAVELAQQEDAVQEAAGGPAGQSPPLQQQAEEPDGQPPPPPAPEEQPPPAPPQEKPPSPPADSQQGAAEQPGPAPEQPEPAAEQPGSPAEQPGPAGELAPAHSDDSPADQLPPPLAAAAAQPPEGFRLASAWELLELGEGAAGQPLAVATLPSGGWQLALVRQCSAAHGLLQVQFEHEGMLLMAQEEGATFLLSVPLNGSPPS
ncbi:hypothetical protein COHA_002682 [Chlorella ohadii]|uniref:Uncharacterized protein n=1 Tax=Chlorella ohadii TaxID=2649997 RepID=A0AAD5H4A4_9CHLO|nr:hypothetical protein COHA_002682 [Chlorella ohadii]